MKFCMEINVNDEMLEGKDINLYNIFNSAIRKVSSVMDPAGGTIDVGLFTAIWGFPHADEKTPPPETDEEAGGEPKS